MYKLFLGTILCFFISLSANAQNFGRERRGDRVPEMVQVERIAFFSEKIGLTPEEAQQFWPIYNEMDQKRTELFEKREDIINRSMNEPEKIKNNEWDEMLQTLTNIQQQEAELPIAYTKKFRTVLSAEKVMKVYVAEIQFRTYLLQKIRTRNPNGPNPRPN